VTLAQVTDETPVKVGEGAEEYKVVGGDKFAFPSEYSVSGWF